MPGDQRSQALGEYRRKRDFGRTPEPTDADGDAVTADAGIFVIQKHAARRLHYDFRLELDGTLKSWAVPKGPSLDPHDKRMAVQVEDHPLGYASFEGEIPAGQYGAGQVIVWDRGTWQPEGDARRGLAQGKLSFQLQGQKLRGRWALVRMRGRPDDRQPAWLLIKERDEHALEGAPAIVDTAPDSVARRPTAPRHRASPSWPAKLSPQLATLVTQPPTGADWSYEMKFDGYRLLTRLADGEARCYTRNGHDWTNRLPALAQACAALAADGTWLDGEIIVPNAHSAPDFQALQNAFDAGRTSAIVYWVFDLPFLRGEDLRARPLAERRQRLAALLAEAPPDTPLRFSADLEGDPTALLQAAAQAGLEGLIGKRRDAPYVSRRSADWIKLKTRHRQEFVVGGWTDPNGSRTGLGALLLGLHDDDGHLRYAGLVGSGFDTASLASLADRLRALATQRAPFHDAPAKVGTVRRSTPHWVRPTLVAEVSFAQWTTDGKVRHAVFHGLRADKPAASITAERPAAAPMPARSAARVPARAPARKAASSAAASASIRLTHPDRVVDRRSGATKADVAAWWQRAAPLLQPHLQDRPLALLRAPAGIGKPGFFQKHADAGELPAVRTVAAPDGGAALLVADSPEALATLAQMNTLELHTWNVRAPRLLQPDRMVFDLDPGEGVGIDALREAAQLLRHFLQDLSLEPFLKTSGGKGLHLVVPLQPRRRWDEVKAVSKAIVEHVARVLPTRFVAKSGPRNRVGRIFIDYLRNGEGSTTVAAWSLRARPGFGISVPVDWRELPSLSGGDHWTLATIEARLPTGNLPWRGWDEAVRPLGPALKALGLQLAPPRSSSPSRPPSETTMPQTRWSQKRERQYEHVKSSLKARGKPEGVAEEIAARTVNKERARHGEAAKASRSSTEDLSSARRGGLRSHRGEGGRTYAQLYNEARQRGIKGRSRMTKAQLEKAVS